MIVILVQILFIAWMFLCILVHIPAFRKVRRFTTLGGLLPNWYLFTADFLTRDVGLQVKRVDCEPEEWQDLPICRPRLIVHACWNPGRRISKAIFDSCDAIVQARLAGRRDHIVNSIPFRLLSQCARHKVSQGARALRFAVVFRTRLPSGVRKEIVFISPEVPGSLPQIRDDLA